MSNLITVSQGLKDSEHNKIMLSGVRVTRKRNLFMGRTWRTLDVKMGVGILAVHLLALFAPFTFTWGAFFAGFTNYVLCGIFGITLSYHRNLAHHSLKLSCPSGLSTPLLILESYLCSGYILEKYQERKNVEDLKNQVFNRFIRRSYLLPSFAFTTLVYVFGGFTYLVWVVGVATTWGYHVTFLVNSACHIWGNQAWNTGDLSKNNWWVALISFEEGWHNNHHAFEYSARHGLEWWQIDFCWYMIRFLEAVGLATNALQTKDNKNEKRNNALYLKAK
ncbi:hypothetical protein L1987_22808 [Smallanthus sonchifolius]|uniref:Uncharacterized protein n=1 Tax=Smallanthus sonchifolius TaxID=185202 RepID=A0ACB9IHD8_9ASTR|nr:hypothetical protein L1987_22808 [Smallanthus sonchifolius]